MTTLRAPLLALALPLLACGDDGNEDTSASVTNITTVGMTGVVTATTGPVTDSAPVTTGDSADAASADDTNASNDTNPSNNTNPSDDTNNTNATDGTTTAPDATTGIESLSDPPAETTFDSFGESTDGDMCTQSIDIVFSMDVSTSMLGVLQKLENEILSVDDKLKTLSVVPDVNYGLVVFVDDYKIINGGAPYADVQTLKADFNYWWNFTQTNQEVNGGGANSDWPENSIDSLYTAAVAFQWRPVDETLRMVIHCTDDTFGDKGTSLSGILVQHSYDETVAALQAAQVRVFAFGDADATGGPGNNEDVSAGFFAPYMNKPSIPEATDGGAFNINEVNAGTLSLGAAINDSVSSSLCEPYIPQ
jgi:hypothetical protein